MPRTNFEAMDDATINRWAAERDGWTYHKKSDSWTYIDRGIGSYKPPDYATSADATLGLAQRWGFGVSVANYYAGFQGWDVSAYRAKMYKGEQSTAPTFPPRPAQRPVRGEGSGGTNHE